MILVACSAPIAPEALSFEVDTTVIPKVTELPGIDGGPPRPVSSILDDEGEQIDFVSNELLVSTDDDAALQALVDRWNGEIVSSIDPSDADLGLPPYYLIRIDHATADAGQLERDLRAFEPASAGEFKVSDEEGLGILAAAASEASREELLVTANFVLEPAQTQFLAPAFVAPNRTTEAPEGWNQNRTLTLDTYRPNAFFWPYMNRTGIQRIGVVDAWRTLIAAGIMGPDHLGVMSSVNKVTVMVVDGGFSPNLDFPDISSLPAPSPNPWSCGGSPCPWHGTDVIMALAGRFDNEFGAAGPAGPVARVIGVQTPDYSLSNIIWWLTDSLRFAIDILGENPKIMNFSGGGPIPFPLNKAANLVANPFFSSLRLRGTLVFASAGNDGKDVNRTRGRGPFRHQKYTYAPCEWSRVVCVGGLREDSTRRDPGSSFGSGGGVDIFAPFEVWLGPNPEDRANGGLKNIARFTAGTSFSSPFVAGVAALVWAADPSLSAGQVENVLMATAHLSSDPDVPRYVNAFGAVASVLGNTPPMAEILTPNDGAVVDLNRRVSLVANVQDAEQSSATLAVEWNSSVDGHLGTATNLTHVFETEGQRTISVVVTDAQGLTATESVEIDVVNSPPEPFVMGPDGVVPATAQAFFVGGAKDRNDGLPTDGIVDVPCDRISWSVSAPDVVDDPVGCQVLVTLNEPGLRTVTVTATDMHGLSASRDALVGVGPVPPNPPPVITAFEVSDATGAVLRSGDSRCSQFGNPWNLSAAASDPEGDPITFSWRASYAGGTLFEVGAAASVQWNPNDTFNAVSGTIEGLVVHLVVSDGTTEMLSPSVTVDWGACIL